MKNIGILSLLFLLLFSACRQDDTTIKVVDEITPPTIIEGYQPRVTNIVGSVIGFVIDENNQPVANASVTLSNQSTSTDDYGHFFFNNTTLNAKGTLVQVQKEGYFAGSRRFFPLEAAKSRVKIELLTKTFDQTFDAQNGGLVTMPSGASIDFAAGSIKSADGSAYNGTVKVATKWMDPSAVRTFNQMPGNLQGVNLSNQEVVLGTYGMIAVELENEAGEALNIADDQTATIKMPVPASMQANAPAEIPLWSYNETHGVWVQESKAVLQDGAFVGEVSHFSFWNCDLPYEWVDLEMTLVDPNGTTLSNYLVTISLDGVGSGTGYTDQNGAVSGAIPANVILTMDVHDVCGVVIYTQQIGPFSVDTDLGNVTVTPSGTNTTTITGNLVDCDDVAISNGLVIINFDGQSVYEHTDGSTFTVTFNTCTSIADVSVLGIDLDASVQSDEYIATGGTTTDLGDVEVCDIQLENYISITVDGVTVLYPGAMIGTDSSSTYLYVQDQNQAFFVGVGFNGDSVGDYSDENFLEGISDQSQGWSLFSNNFPTFTAFTVSEFGMVGESIKGTFSGVLLNGPTGVNANVSGEFDITR